MIDLPRQRLLAAVLIGGLELGVAVLDLSIPDARLTLAYCLPVVLASLAFSYMGYVVSLAVSLGLVVFIERLGQATSIDELDLIRLAVLVLVGLVVAVATEDRNKLRALSRTDPLTGLANYRWFSESLAAEIRRSRRYHHDVSLILADLDDFKSVNDRYGHQAGNAVLKNVAWILREVLRDVDLPARYGGDEFAIILPETEKREAVQTAERLRRVMESHAFPGGRSQPIRVTASFGVASFPHDASTPDDLVARADRALYLSKEQGRDRVRAAQPVLRI